jgi:hypothetical protein
VASFRSCSLLTLNPVNFHSVGALICRDGAVKEPKPQLTSQLSEDLHRESNQLKGHMTGGREIMVTKMLEVIVAQAGAVVGHQRR